MDAETAELIVTLGAAALNAVIAAVRAGHSKEQVLQAITRIEPSARAIEQDIDAVVAGG